ncbi:hypothetical protein [Salsuginibacillus kocurii]|uniref:hypothetical protein n=1 Tax=Salsuginibacillus kocurii TaxID=427078 RepID=UPI000378154C|nr:hypothetical protein [Salsuginibacillus kocurii]
MWLYIISYALHWLMALFFFLLLPLPFLLKGATDVYRTWLLKTYRIIIHLAHLGVIGSLITGLFITETFLSAWMITVFILWLAISAFLGLTAKALRLEHSNAVEKSQTDSFRNSLILSLLIFTMFAVKFFPWLDGVIS